MILRMSDWDRIRDSFSQEEKDKLNAAITGQVICPRGCVIDESKVPELSVKIRSLLGGK